RKPAPTKGCFRPHVPPAFELKDGGGVPEDKWMGLAGQLQSARVEVAKMGYLHCLACLELADLEAELDVGEANAKGEDKEEEDWEAKIAIRNKTVDVGPEEEEEEGEEVEAKRAKRDKEDEREEAKRAKRREEVEREEMEAKRAERDAGPSEAFLPLPCRVRPGSGEMAWKKRERMVAKKAALRKMRRA
ncbi:hypothetical protein C0991_008472, partial [Blastosporella zonata]